MILTLHLLIIQAIVWVFISSDIFPDPYELGQPRQYYSGVFST